MYELQKLYHHLFDWYYFSPNIAQNELSTSSFGSYLSFRDLALEPPRYQFNSKYGPKQKKHDVIGSWSIASLLWIGLVCLCVFVLYIRLNENRVSCLFPLLLLLLRLELMHWPICLCVFFRNDRAGVSDPGHGGGAERSPWLHRWEGEGDASEHPEDWAGQHPAATDHRQPRPRQTG